MKWIGQHIYNLVSRFRGDVYINKDLYLEQVTNASGGFSNLQADHRILYLTGTSGKVEYSADFEYDSANEKLTIGDIDSGYAYIARTPRVAGESNSVGGSFSLHAGQGTGSATGGLIELGTSAAGSSGTSVNAITEKLILWPNIDVSGFAGSGTAGGHDSDFVQVTMPGGLGVYTDANPKVVLGPATTTAQTGGLGVIEWHGINANSELLDFGRINCQVVDNTNGDEAGSMAFSVAKSNGSFSSLGTALQLIGSNADNDVNVTIGSGSTSITTINGFLSLGGHAINDIDIGSEFVDSDEHLMTSAAINARIAAATTGASVDLTSEVSGILPVANGGTGASSLADNSILTGTGTSAITAEANLTWDASMLTVSSTGDAGEPIIKIHQTQDAVPTTGGELRFDTDRGDGLVGNADDVLGTITWRGHDNQTGGGAAETIYASVVGLIQDPQNTLGSEDGKLEFNVLNQNVSNTGLLISPTGVNGHVNATIGKGTVGTVTVEGYLSLGGHSVNDIDITSEASDANDHLMTALAIKNRIEDYGYATASSLGISGSANQLLTDDGDGTVTSESELTYSAGIFSIESASSQRPSLRLTNTNADAEAPELSFKKSATGADNDVIGNTYYIADNDADEVITYAQTYVSIKDASDTDEAGAYEIKVATSDGSTSALQNAFSANGHGTNNTVGATIGHGAASLVTVPGVLSALSGITFDGVSLTTLQTSAESFADNDTSLMTSAAIDDRINAAGGGVSVSDSTANTNFPVVFHDESNNLHDDTGAFTYNPSTGTANIPIASIPKRKFAIPADGAGNADGDVVYIGTGSTVIGKIYYYKSDGSWGLTNSDDPGTATGWLAVALGTDPDVDGMLVRGTVDLATDIVGTEALGSILYLDKATTGTATTAAPTATGDIVRVIGYALTTGNANKIWFSPDNTWVEHV